MQKIATKVFICASIAFGVLGILMVLTSNLDNDNTILNKLFTTTIFIILPSFALSVAGKYLKSK